MSETIKVAVEFDVVERYRGFVIVYGCGAAFEAVLNEKFFLASGDKLMSSLCGWRERCECRKAIDEFIGTGYELIDYTKAKAGDDFWNATHSAWDTKNTGKAARPYLIYRRKLKLEENVFDRIQAGQPTDAERSPYELLGDVIKKLEEVRAKTAPSSAVDIG